MSRGLSVVVTGDCRSGIASITSSCATLHATSAASLSGRRRYVRRTPGPRDHDDSCGFSSRNALALAQGPNKPGTISKQYPGRTRSRQHREGRADVPPTDRYRFLRERHGRVDQISPDTQSFTRAAESWSSFSAVYRYALCCKLGNGRHGNWLINKIRIKTSAF